MQQETLLTLGTIFYVKNEEVIKLKALKIHETTSDETLAAAIKKEILNNIQCLYLNLEKAKQVKHPMYLISLTCFFTEEPLFDIA